MVRAGGDRSDLRDHDPSADDDPGQSDTLVESETVQLGINTIKHEQVFVGAVFCHHAVFDDDDLVGVAQGAHAMGDGDDAAASHQSFQRLDDQMLRLAGRPPSSLGRRSGRNWLWHRQIPASRPGTGASCRSGAIDSTGCDIVPPRRAVQRTAARTSRELYIPSGGRLAGVKMGSGRLPTPMLPWA
jgi:hypothetical protein